MCLLNCPVSLFLQKHFLMVLFPFVCKGLKEAAPAWTCSRFLPDKSGPPPPPTDASLVAKLKVKQNWTPNWDHTGSQGSGRGGGSTLNYW